MEPVSESFTPMSSEDMKDEMKETGTFVGHIVPGLLIVIMSFLWTYNNLLRYHAARKEALYTGGEGSEIRYKSSLFSKYDDSSRYVLAEPCAVILVGIIASLVEVRTVVLEIAPLSMAVPHVNIYLCYSLMAVCVILRQRKHHIPPNAEHAVFLVANAVQGYIFMNHRHHGLSLKVHFTHGFFNFITAMCVACEIAHRRSVLAALGRTLSFLAQGLWLTFLAFCLYPPSFMPTWEATDRSKEDSIPMIVALDFVFVTLVGFFMYFAINQRVKKLKIANLNRNMACFGYTKVPFSENLQVEKESYSRAEA